MKKMNKIKKIVAWQTPNGEVFENQHDAEAKIIEVKIFRAIFRRLYESNTNFSRYTPKEIAEIISKFASQNKRFLIEALTEKTYDDFNMSDENI